MGVHFLLEKQKNGSVVSQSHPQTPLEKVERTLLRSERRAASFAKSMLHYKRFSRFMRILGPGVVTGAADDDPSGIATYSQAGSMFGFGLLWAFPLMYPLLMAVQESCARIGAVTGKGLAAVIKDHYSRKLLYASVALVVIANTINIGADLGAMAATTQLLIPLPFSVLAVLYAIVTLALVLLVPYKTYAKMLKWLALALLAYPLTAILVNVDWSVVIRATFMPEFAPSSEVLFLLVGMLGTTISPYLFFWDTSEVVEEEIAKHRLKLTGSEGPRLSKHFLKNVRVDTFFGMTVAVLTAWFIVVTCASVLHQNGITEINSAADAARAIEPLVQGFPDAGMIAKLIFVVGVVGLGLLAVPVLAGSAAYAISEAIGWREGLHYRVKRAGGFYGVIVVATIAGLGLNFMGVNPINALVFAAVFNGVAAVPLILLILRIGRNQDIMGEHVSGRVSTTFVSLAFIVMLSAVVVMFISLL